MNENGGNGGQLAAERKPRSAVLAGDAAGRFGLWLGQAGLPFLLVAYLGLRGGGFDEIVRSEVGIAAWWIVLLGAAVGVLPLARLSRGAWIALGLFAAFAVWTGLAVGWSESAERSLDELGRVAALLAVFALALSVQGADGLRRAVGAVGAAIALVSGRRAAFAAASGLVPGPRAAGAAAGRTVAAPLPTGLLERARGLRGDRDPAPADPCDSRPERRDQGPRYRPRPGAGAHRLLHLVPRRCGRGGHRPRGPVRPPSRGGSRCCGPALAAGAGARDPDRGREPARRARRRAPDTAGCRPGERDAGDGDRRLRRRRPDRGRTRDRRAPWDRPDDPRFTLPRRCRRRRAGDRRAGRRPGRGCARRALRPLGGVQGPDLASEGADRFDAASGSGRYQLWDSALDANASEPLLGIGPGTFEFW